MKHAVTVLTVLGLGAAAMASATAIASEKAPAPWLKEPVRTASGLISGVPGALPGVAAFKGSPFGAPPVGELRWKPPAPVSAWQGVRAGDKFGAACLQPHQKERNPNNRSGTWPDDYWPKKPAPPNSRSWQRSLAAFRRDRRAVERLAANLRLNLHAKIPHGDGQTYLREILLVADHNAFHVGEIVVVRRLLGAWK